MDTFVHTLRAVRAVSSETQTCTASPATCERSSAPWTAWLKQWNDEHPGHGIETASNLRAYFL
jgi:hypothetical protein